jgi:hypothetical protein
MYVGLQYHILMAPEGMLLVPRAPQHSLKGAYADVQGWDVKEWAAHPQISLAVTEHGRSDLISEGVQRGILDGLRSTLIPEQEQVSTSTRGWEPADPPDAPAPIANGKVADTQKQPEKTAPPRRSILPLAELFGFQRSQGKKEDATRKQRTEAITPVLPTGTIMPPEVELLPSPDEVDLGQPQPLPRRPNSEWRQTDVNVNDGQRTAHGQLDWEPLTSVAAGRNAS